MKQWAIDKLLKRRNRPTNLLLVGDPRLKEVSKPYDLENTTLNERLALLRLMATTLQSQKWGDKLGIAAPQIGINTRVIIVLGIPMFNPEWHPARGVETARLEGCYSLPKGDVYEVVRPRYGWAKWYDAGGQLVEEKLTEIKAIVFQHELSHLDGKCCDELGTKIEKANILRP